MTNLTANEAQLTAIEHDTGPALVIAGPGSGKTFVITHRICNLISNHGVNPQNILVITFTKAAALQMKERTEKISDNRVAGVNFGTFHALFYRILIEEGLYDSQSLITDKEKHQIVFGITNTVEELKNTDQEKINQIISDIGRYKNHTISKSKSDFIPLSTDISVFTEIFNEYDKKLNSIKKLDFDDMQIEALKLLENNEKVRKKYQDRFKYIMIDEFQDINSLQMSIIKYLFNDCTNLFVVGDDDQSIYGFRGSKPDIMLGFLKEYPSAQKIILDYNYRCAANIIDASSLVIAKNENRFMKLVKPARKDRGIVKIIDCKDRVEEVAMLIDFINQHSDELNDIAIITRTNRISAYYAQELADRNIEIRLRERINDIYSTFVGKDIVAYLRLINGDMSRGNFLYIYNKPERNISREALDEVIDFNRIIDFQKKVYGNSKEIERLYKDVMLLKKMSAFAVVHYILYKIGYLNFLKKYARSHHLDYESLCDNAMEILEHAKAHKSVKEFIKSIEDYQEEIANNNASLKVPDANDGKSAVNIMTMHASKGLEFNYVFLPDVIEGIVPYKKALSTEQIEEERRLFYVAMTRTKDELYVISIQQYLDKKTTPSRFLADIENVGCL